MDELKQLKTLTESLQHIEEASVAVVFQDMAGDGEFVAFANSSDYETYTTAEQILGIGAGYPGETLSPAPDVEPETVVPSALIRKLAAAISKDNARQIKAILNKVNDYYFEGDDY